MQDPISLSELNQLIRQTLDRHLPPNFWVVAEIGEIKDSPKGHAYLELVEKSANQLVAKMKANIWSYTYQGIRTRFIAATGQNISQGMKILALVQVNFHELYGLSITVKDIDPNFTLGERARKKQEIIDRLTREGLIHLNRQFVLPRVPQKLAIISSPSAAGFGDFIDQLEHNPQGYRIHWKLYPAIMQGNESAGSIINALSAIEADLTSKGLQLLVIIRGGGAKTDMDCFDDYQLAKAIANTSLPVVTGIGHERDECIADLVANTKMKTPTAVAEFVLSGFRDFEDELNTQLKRMERLVSSLLQKEDRLLRDKEHLLKSLFLNKTGAAKERLNAKKQQLSSMVLGSLRLDNVFLQNLEISLKRNARQMLEKEKNTLKAFEKDLSRLDPYYFLNRGYTRTELNGIPVNQASIGVGDELVTSTLTQKIKSKIIAIEKHDQ
jgi:exodeoxyribonuclease VII large subunit